MQGPYAFINERPQPYWEVRRAVSLERAWGTYPYENSRSKR